MRPCLALLLGYAVMGAKISWENDIQLMDGTPDLSELNIVKVLNTSEKMWFYQTSHSGEDVGTYTCIFNTMNNISMQEYNFTQTYREAFSGELNITLSGRFINRPRGKPPLSMLVKNPYNKTKQHTLMFWDGKGCSVFYVNLYNNLVAKESPICELYLLNSYVDKGPKGSCKAFYDYYCEELHLVFKEECKQPATTFPSIFDYSSVSSSSDYYDYRNSFSNNIER